jgi:hypothetical protein
MIVKFDHTDPFEFPEVIEYFVLDDPGPPPQQVLGWRIDHPTLGSISLNDGDYIIAYPGDVRVISNSDYESNEQLRRLVIKEIAIKLTEDMIQALQDLPVTDAVKLDLLKTVDVVLIMVVGNKIPAARTACNAIATTANFTTTRKNVLLGMLDDAMDLL